MKQLSFSIIVTNWRRQKNIPNIIDRWASQDYPKDKYEIIIIDDNSPNKKEVFEIMRDILLVHGDLDVRFFETYKSVTYNPALRYNIGARHAKNEVLILNESDILIQGRNYLSIANEEHIKDDMLWLSPRILSWDTDPSELIEEPRSQKGDCADLGASIRKENYTRACGCDENIKGWGGLEIELSHRLEQVGVHEKQNRDLTVLHCNWTCMGFSQKPGSEPYDPYKAHAGPSHPEEKKTWLLGTEIIRKRNEWGLLDTLEELKLEDLINACSRNMASDP